MNPRPPSLQSDTDMLRSMSVLCIEDDEDVRNEMVEALARKMGKVYSATDGEEGLSAFQRIMPDIVISDIQMPRMDGLEMATAIKRLSPDTPIIIATAFSDSHFLLKAIAAGIDKFLPKPVEKAALREALLQCARPLCMAKQLRASEARYRTMMEQASDGIFLSDREGRYLEVNARGCEMLGFSREEILQFNIRDLVRPERHTALAQGMAEALAGKAQLCESKLRHKNGGHIDCEVSFGRLSDGTIMATLRDISARKKMEASLHKSQASLTRAQRVAHVGNWEIDVESDNLSWSDETYRIAFIRRPTQFCQNRHAHGGG